MRILNFLVLTMAMTLLMGQGCPGTSPPPDNTPPDNTPPDSSTPLVLPNGVIAVRQAATGANNGLSWKDAYTDLQDAIAAGLMPGSTVQQIWVAQGTYKPSSPGGDSFRTFLLVNNVAIYGGFAGTESQLTERDIVANSTILSADINGDDGPSSTNQGENSRIIVSGNDLLPTAILDGFTLTAAQSGALSIGDASPIIRNCTFTANSASFGGAAVGIFNSGTPLFIACVFRGNKVSESGGAIYAQLADLDVRDSTFEDNSAGAGGALYLVSKTAKVTRCTFQNNSAQTGGAICHRSDGSKADSLSMHNCVFKNNSSKLETTAAQIEGGGAVFSDASGFTAENCIFLQNTAASFGGAIHSLAQSDLIGSVFDRNTASEGGAAYISGFLTALSCTLSKNAATSVGGGLSLLQKDFSIANDIFWGNTDSTGINESSQINFGGGLDPISGLNFCDIQGLSAALGAKGQGNISLDPLFVDRTNGNLRLKPNSPCIDKGNSDLGFFDYTTDLDGKPRVLGSPPIMDIGAYEQ